MTATTAFECDYCGRTVTEMAGQSPLGWWEVPGKGRDGNCGHACADCMTGDPRVYEDVIARRDGETRRILGEKPTPAVEDIPIH